MVQIDAIVAISAAALAVAAVIATPPALEIQQLQLTGCNMLCMSLRLCLKPCG